MQGLERHPSFRKSGGAQTYFAKVVATARDYMDGTEQPTTDGLCGAIDRAVESMVEKADGPKPTKSTVEQVNALREAVSAALRKLQALEENRYLSKAVAAAVETMVQENTMVPATPVEEQPKVKRAEKRAKVKSAEVTPSPKGEPLPMHKNDAVLAVADQGLAAVMDAAAKYPNGPPADKAEEMRAKAASMDKPRKGPRINAKATLDDTDLAAL